MAKPDNVRKSGRVRLTLKSVRKALDDAGGIQAIAAQVLGVNRSTICRFVAKHHELQIQIIEKTEEMNDVAEAQLVQAVRKGEPWAVKYWLENRGQERGFGMRRMAFKDGEGNVQVPGVLVGSGRMSPEEWEATPWAQQAEDHRAPAAETIQ